MINTLFGFKKGMTSSYDARGRRVAATVLEINPNLVSQVKTKESKDGYDSVQLGIGLKSNVKQPQQGHLKKAKIESKVHFLKEVRTNDTNLTLGESVELSKVFKTGDAVKVTGVSKGKGFQGGVKRHGFAGGPKTHGQSDRERAPGSIGQTTTPGRVYKGKRMAGHMGAETVSVRGLEIVKVNKQDNLLIVKGAVPGANGSLIRIEKIGKIKHYVAPPEEKEEEEPAEQTESTGQADVVKEGETNA